MTHGSEDRLDLGPRTQEDDLQQKLQQDELERVHRQVLDAVKVAGQADEAPVEDCEIGKEQQQSEVRVAWSLGSRRTDFGAARAAATCRTGSRTPAAGP